MESKRDLAKFTADWIVRRKGVSVCSPEGMETYDKIVKDLLLVTRDTLAKLADVVDDVEAEQRELSTWLESGRKILQQKER